MSGLPFLCRAGCTCFFAIAADYLIQKKCLSKTRIRKLFTFFGKSSLNGFPRCNNIIFSIYYITLYYRIGCWWFAVDWYGICSLQHIFGCYVYGCQRNHEHWFRLRIISWNCRYEPEFLWYVSSLLIVFYFVHASYFQLNWNDLQTGIIPKLCDLAQIH